MPDRRQYREIVRQVPPAAREAAEEAMVVHLARLLWFAVVLVCRLDGEKCACPAREPAAVAVRARRPRRW